MPRRKKHIISAKETTIYKTIVDELMKNPELAADYDMETIQITILKTHKPQIRNLDQAISNLKRYIAINEKYIKDNQNLFFKKDIAKMLKISRSTLDKWIKDGFITPVESSSYRNLEIYPPNLILEQLLKQKK